MSSLIQIAQRPATHIQEKMSSAYISAVAARAGYICTPTGASDDYGVDYYLHQIAQRGKKYQPVGVPVTLQAKATTDSALKNGSLELDLDSDAYNKVVSANNEANPTAIVVFRMPIDDKIWLQQDEDCLRLSHCAYWDFLRGDPTENKRSQRIRIPQGQVFSVDCMSDLFRAADKIRRFTSV